MQLSKVVGAILNDLSKAQDLANDYSSQLSHKYKKKQVENKDDNILSNFQVPAVVLREISFDLKFVIKEINLDGFALDVDKTLGKCDEIGRTAVKNLLLEDNKVVKGLLSAGFDNKLEKSVSHCLFTLCRSFFMWGNDLTISEIQNTIAEKLKDELFNHDDIQSRLKRVDSADQKKLKRVEKETKELEELCLNSANIISDDEIDIKTIIQKVRGSPNTEVIFDSETLQKMPTEVIQSLRISANYDNYQWTISEGSQSFYKT